MKNLKSNQLTTDHLMCALSGRAVPLGFNLESNRYPLPIACCSDCTTVQAWFYEYHGMYWYSVTVAGRSTMNSIPFLGIQTAITEFRSFLRAYGFVFVDSKLAETRIRGLRCEVSSKSPRAKPSKSWRV